MRLLYLLTITANLLLYIGFAVFASYDVFVHDIQNLWAMFLFSLLFSGLGILIALLLFSKMPTKRTDYTLLSLRRLASSAAPKRD